MKAQDAAGDIVPADRRKQIQEGLRQFGDLFLSRRARQAQSTGRPLPDDPYVKNWYQATEKEIFSAVGGEVAYQQLYGPASEWHHWRVGGLGPMLTFDKQTQTFTWTINNRREITAGALAAAFMCLWQTLSTLEDVAQRGIRVKLTQPPALAMPANKKEDPRYTGIYRDMPGYSGMRPRRLRPMT